MALALCRSGRLGWQRSGKIEPDRSITVVNVHFNALPGVVENLNKWEYCH
jgi:hypothetical protein